MSSEQEIKATVTIEGEVSMGRYYVPNADMDETRKRLREAEFRLQGREGMSSSGHWFKKEIKATVRIVGKVSMSVGDDHRNVPFLNIDPMYYYLPGVDMDGTRAKLREAGFEIEGHIRDCQGAGCGATCVCPCHVGELRG